MICLQNLIQENKPVVTNQRVIQDGQGPVAATVTESDLKVTVEKELVSQAEEEDMEALLGTCVLFTVLSAIWNLCLCYIL